MLFPTFSLQVLSELNGKVLSDVIAEGMGKLASMPSGMLILGITRTI